MKKTEKLTQTKMAEICGVHRSTISNWQKRTDFPEKPKAQNLRRYAAKRLRSIAENQKGPDSDLKREKLIAQIARLKVQTATENQRLKREKIATQEKAGLLHNVAECEADVSQAGAALRGAVDAFQKYETAKNPAHRSTIDGLCSRFLAALRSAKL